MVEVEYARAIFDLALEEKSLDSFSSYFKIVKETLDYEEFYNLMTSPTVTDEDKKQVIDKVFGQLSSTFVTFLKVLVDHHRFSIFDDILLEYEKMILSVQNTLSVKVVSAVKLTSEQNNHILGALKKKYLNKQIVIENLVDPSLIGGVQIISNGQSLDISIKSAIDKLKVSL